MKPKTPTLPHDSDGGIFPFHYGNEAEQYTFYRIPKLLFDDPYFGELRTDAKVLYGLMLDRMSLSLKNGWLDTAYSGIHRMMVLEIKWDKIKEVIG